MKEIPLTQGKVALVDDEDYEKVNKYKWYAHKRSNNLFYVQRNVFLNGKRIEIISLHRYILNLNDKKVQVDHKDGNGLNNQKINLRLCTASQNMMNRRKFIYKVKYKGVYIRNRGRNDHIMAQIKIPHHIHRRFNSEIEAAKWYDEMAVKHFGEFAKTNKMLGLLD